MVNKPKSKNALLKGLTAKQKAFCREFVIDWNGSRAYKVAYPNVTDETARVNASKLLTKTNVQSYCEEIQKDLEKLTGISKAKVVNEHKKIAFDEAEEPQHKQKSLDSIAKLFGYDSAGKVELTGKGGKDLIQSVQIEIINSASQVKKDDTGS
jgi:hypothetical protein